MNKSTDFFNIFQQPYEFYLINEPEFEQYSKDLFRQPKEAISPSKQISTLGLIVEFDTNNYKGDLQYKDTTIKVDFTHMAALFKWVKRAYYFIYGILEKDINADNPSLIIKAKFIRIVEDIKLDEYIPLAIERRKICKECSEIKAQNDFWILANKQFSTNA